MKTKLKTAPTAQAPVRKIRDREAGPVVEAKPEIPLKVKRLLLAKITERESARLRKNAATSEEGAAKKELEALMEEHGIKSVGGEIEIDGEPYDTSASYVTKQTKVLDIEMLQRLVKKDIWKKCLVAQVTLVEKFAGKNVVAQATTYKDGEPSLEITLNKKGGKDKKAKK